MTTKLKTTKAEPQGYRRTNVFTSATNENRLQCNDHPLKVVDKNNAGVYLAITSGHSIIDSLLII